MQYILTPDQIYSIPQELFLWCAGFSILREDMGGRNSQLQFSLIEKVMPIFGYKSYVADTFRAWEQTLCRGSSLSTSKSLITLRMFLTGLRKMLLSELQITQRLHFQ